MSAPRVLGYDDLHNWLEAEADDADMMAQEYKKQGDDLEAAEHSASADAYRAVLRHIEYELAGLR